MTPEPIDGENDSGHVVVKTMSLSQAEFDRSMRILAPENAPSKFHSLPCGAGCVVIRYDALPSVTLGTLLALPRARITLTFSTVVTADDRARVLERFDLAFQRGGG